MLLCVFSVLSGGLCFIKVVIKGNFNVCYSLVPGCTFTLIKINIFAKNINPF